MTDCIKFSYKYDVLWESRNKKYAKKERKNSSKILAIKVLNNSRDTIDFNDVKLFSADKLIVPIPNEDLYDQFKQSTPSYILYLLFTPVHKFSVNLNGPSNIFPFGLILGPVLAGWNMMVAAGANSDFEYELEKYNIRDQKIPPGDTMYGLIGIEVDDYIPLTLRLMRK